MNVTIWGAARADTVVLDAAVPGSGNAVVFGLPSLAGFLSAVPLWP